MVQCDPCECKRSDADHGSLTLLFGALGNTLHENLIPSWLNDEDEWSRFRKYHVNNLKIEREPMW